MCSLLSDKIKKCDTKYREAITVNERVLITLRFLATGDAYSSLQYLFRVSKQSISTIVPEVCDAIIEALSDYVKVNENNLTNLKINCLFKLQFSDSFESNIGVR